MKRYRTDRHHMIASFDVMDALRRREQAAAAAAERVREKIRSREQRRAKLRAAFLGLLKRGSA